MDILLDIGNSRIKWCASQGQGLGKVESLIHQHGDFLLDLQQQWSKQPRPETVLIASVANQQRVEQLIELSRSLWPDVEIRKAYAKAQYQTMHNAYLEPEKLGIDRWLALIALYHAYPQNSIVVDCGTAITLDMLDDQGQHGGGMICPGIRLMKQSLCQETAKLSDFQQTYAVQASRSTSAAMYSGVLLAAAGLIEKTLAQYGNIEKLVMTGGDAELIAEHLNCEYIIHPGFVLTGLLWYGQDNWGLR